MKRLSASKFLKLATHQPEKIKSVRFVLPKIGKKGDFGYFVVEGKK